MCSVLGRKSSNDDESDTLDLISLNGLFDTGKMKVSEKSITAHATFTISSDIFTCCWSFLFTFERIQLEDLLAYLLSSSLV